jgi:hypothetical protein
MNRSLEKGEVMAVGVEMTMPKVTAKQYEQLNREIFGHYPMKEGDAPTGLIVHSAGPVPTGWQVYDVWETKADFERFGKERIAPVLQQVTGLGFGDLKPTFVQIHNLLPPATTRRGNGKRRVTA